MKLCLDSATASDAFVRQVDEAIRQFLFPAVTGQRVMVAFSGGPDSTALLLSLKALSTSLDLSLCAGHVNHGLRAAESDCDQEFCQSVCASLGIPFQAERLKESCRGEGDLRAGRYRLLKAMAALAGAQVLSCGHTLDDQIETMLFRLFRGTGPFGLSGMAWFRPLGGELTLVRPLLLTRRSQVLDFLGRLGLNARSDSSNDSTTYSRNYIRHCLTPLIEQRFAGFVERMEQCRQLIAFDEEFFAGLVEQSRARLSATMLTDPAALPPNAAMEAKAPPAPPAPPDERLSSDSSRRQANQRRSGKIAVSWDLAEFTALPRSIARRLLACEFRRLGIEPSLKRICSAESLTRKPGSSGLSLDGRFDLHLRNGRLFFVEKPSASTSEVFDDAHQCLAQVPGLTETPWSGHFFQVECLAPSDRATVDFPSSASLEALVDLSAIEGPLFVRTRRPGDCIRPFGMNELVKLKKYLHTHKTGQMVDRLENAFVVADASEVLWVPGVGLSNKIRVEGAPTHRFVWLKAEASD